MNSALMKICMTVLSIGLLAGSGLADLPKWPLKNGDFSVYVGGGQPAHWGIGINSGKFETKAEQIKETWRDFPWRRTSNPPKQVIVSVKEAGECYYYQNLPLLQGTYRLNVEVFGTPGSKAKLSYASGESRQSGEWVELSEKPQLLHFEVKAGADTSTVSLNISGAAGQAITLRNFSLDILSLKSSPAPFEKGAALGAVAIPAKPTEAERYAAYELQRYIHKMTGHVPGLQGRDKVSPGRVIYLGRATSKSNLQKLKGCRDDAFVVSSEGNSIVLAGNNDRGVLYAVYDFLNQQGYRWVLPGDNNETVPQRKTLRAVTAKAEGPAYDCRGVMVVAAEFFPGGGQEMGWNEIDYDDYFDWATRNRMNALWFAEIASYDFGAHRGHGWAQLLNHSYNSLIAPHDQYFKTHPEWYALVRGKRMPVCDVSPFFANQLCVSSHTLRDFTVDVVLDYFKRYPDSQAFPLNPMDGPSYWCECEECKKLDPPGLDWPRNEKGGMEPGMTDRALDYANEVAGRVAKVYPNKLIEMYAYSFTIHPPVKTRVHKNVMIKYANLNRPGYGSLGKSILDKSDPRWSVSAQQLADWKKMGAQHLFLYNYFDYMHPDASLYWFYNTSDMIKNLNSAFGFNGVLGETESNPKTSPMLYQIVAQALWNPNADYKKVIRDTADNFYGPAAADMYNFNLLMDEEIKRSTASEAKDWIPQDHLDLSFEALEKGRIMLEQAAAKVKGDKVLTERIAYARYGHANLTYIRALNEKNKTTASAAIARQAFDLANELRSQYVIMSKYPSVDQLKTFYYPPVLADDRIVMELPDTWDFKIDPNALGTKDQWFARESPGAWAKISTNADWTSQEPGHNYHGTAWYQIDFTLPATAPKEAKLNLLFGAIDGTSEVYLDGVKIGGSQDDPGVMWDKAFQIALPADLNRSTAHRLIVKVTKASFAAGIWRPVKVITAEATL